MNRQLNYGLSTLLLATLTACASAELPPQNDPTTGTGAGGAGGTAGTGGEKSTNCPPPDTYTQAVYDPRAPFTVLTVNPADTDPAITMLPDGEHRIVFADGVPRRGQLLLLFAGTGGDTDDASHVLRTAATAGYHTVALHYVNHQSVSISCQGQDPSCHGTVLQEKIYGDSGSSLLSIGPENSVIHRIDKLLNYLIDERPADEDWQSFRTTDGQVDWTKIVVMGGSQGGKVAAYLSRDFSVARAVLLSAMGSAYKEDGKAKVSPWSLEPRATPPLNTFGLWHAQEAANNYAPVILESYGVDALGTTIDTDNVLPPYGCTHMLRTNLMPSSGNPEHAHPSLGKDDVIAIDAQGVPLLAPVWMYMLTSDY